MSRHDHYWLSTGIPHALVFLNGKFKYECSVCGKTKYCRQQPVNPIVPSAWDAYNQQIRSGNAHLVIAPPVLARPESELTRGERYAKLIKERRL